MLRLLSPVNKNVHARHNARAMRLLGFRPQPGERRALTAGPNSTEPCPWLKANLMVFRRHNDVVQAKKADAAQMGVQRLQQMLSRPVSSSFSRLYLQMTNATCDFYEDDGCRPTTAAWVLTQRAKQARARIRGIAHSERQRRPDWRQPDGLPAATAHSAPESEHATAGGMADGSYL